MQKLLPALFLAAGLLVGCATTENFEKKVSVYVGKTENHLVAAEGIPSSSYELDGTKYLTYSKSESGVIPGTPARANTNYINGKAYTTMVGGSPAIGYTNTCSVTFTVVNKVITGYTYKGNDCKAYE